MKIKHLSQIMLVLVICAGTIIVKAEPAITSEVEIVYGMVPSGVSARATSMSSISLSWTESSTTETGFQIEKSLNGTSGFVLVATVASNSTSYHDSGLASNTTYYYRIRTMTGATGSAYSAVVSATTSVASENIYWREDGSVAIGGQEIPEGYKLAIHGKVIAEGVKVLLQGDWPDYVFEPGYKLTDIPSLKKYIEEYGHLPNVPDAASVEKEGINIGQMNVILLEKIEEMSLHLIKMEERIKALESENDSLRSDTRK
jgi:hypothetical protein